MTNQRRPLGPQDSLQMTLGCRHSNPNICKNNGTGSFYFWRLYNQRHGRGLTDLLGFQGEVQLIKALRADAEGLVPVLGQLVLELLDHEPADGQFGGQILDLEVTLGQQCR